MGRDIVLSRVLRTVKDTISLEDIVFYSTHGQLEVLTELSEMHVSAAYSPESHTPPAHPFTLTHVYSLFCRSSGFRTIFYCEHGAGYSSNEFWQAGIQLDSSPILLRLCHSYSRLLFQNKSTRARNPASYAGFTQLNKQYHMKVLLCSFTHKGLKHIK